MKRRTILLDARNLALFLMVITFVSKILGFARESSIASVFGASSVSDAFFVAFTIPNVIFATMASALATTFIPVYGRLSESSKAYFTNNILTIFGFFTIGLTVLGELFAPGLVRFFGYGFDSQTHQLTVHLTEIMLLSLIFMTFVAILTSTLQSNKSFLMPSAIGIPYNLIVVGYLLLFGSSLGITSFTWIIVISVGVQVLLLMIPLLKMGWRYHFILDLKDQGLLQMLSLVAPVLLGSMVGQVNIVVDRMIASTLMEGSISSLNYALKLNQLSFGIVVMSVISILYPQFTTLIVIKDIDQLKRLINKTVVILLLILVPIIVGGIILAHPIVKLLFEHGSFDSLNTNQTTIAFIMFNLGLIGLSLREVISRVFFSFQDTKTSVWNGMLAVVLNIVLSLILVRFLAHAGLALANSISITIAAVLLYRSLIKKIGGFGNKRILVSAVKFLVASGIMGIAVYFIYPMVDLVGSMWMVQFIWLFVNILMGLIVYVLVLILLKENQTNELIFEFKNKVKAKFLASGER